MNKTNILERYSSFEGVEKLTAIWDFSFIPFKLGNALVFNQNLHLIKELTRCEKIELVVICDPKEQLSNRGMESTNFRSYISKLMNYFLLMETVTTFRIFTSREDFNKYTSSIENENYPRFPPCVKNEEPSFDYKSYSANKEFFLLKHEITFARMNHNYLNIANTFLKNNVGSAFSISVHLRYDPNHRVDANPYFRVWINLLKKMEAEYKNIIFLLIGSDLFPEEVEKKIRSLKNIIRTKDSNVDILEELAIIQASDAFMGTASGPSNMAIFNDKPYLIIKHPKDAWSEKFSEVEEGKRFAFSLPNQHFLIGEESMDGSVDFITACLSQAKKIEACTSELKK